MFLTELLHKPDAQGTDRSSKIFLLMGDNKQIAPVIKHGTKQQIIHASIATSELFHQFQVFRFTKNLRLQESGSYGDMLLEVGMG